MRHIPWKETGWILAFLAVLFGLYAGSYLLVVKDGGNRKVTRSAPFHWADGTVSDEITPIYRYDSDWIPNFYQPIHALDRWLRVRRWNHPPTAEEANMQRLLNLIIVTVTP